MSFISMLLFAAGAVLFFTSRVKIGELNAEGGHVRAAGALMMTPLIGIFALRVVLGAMFSGDLDSLRGVLAFTSLLEFLAWGGALYGAYYLLYQKEGVQSPFANLALNLFEDTEASSGASRGAPLTPAQRQSYPPVMNLSQAARYLKMSEREVLKAIDEGRIAASKGVNGYAIARVVLDDYLADRNGDGGDQES